MKPFNVLFAESHSNEIEYKGKRVIRYFELNEPGEYNIKFVFIKSNSKFNQAIVLLFIDDFVGEYYLNDEKQQIRKKRFFKVSHWMDEPDMTMDVKIILKKGKVVICNGSDPLGTKQINHTLSYGCAIHIEEIGQNKYRFNCNDHEDDDDFDDLIFEMEIVKSNHIIDEL